MNKFAQLAYGKVIYIYETHLTKDDLPQVFSPATYWVDVTGQDVEVGDIASFDENLGIVFTRPEQEEVSEKERKLAQLDEQYEREKRELILQHVDAVIHDDTEGAQSIVGEMTTLDAWYDTEYQKIESEVE